MQTRNSSPFCFLLVGFLMVTRVVTAAPRDSDAVWRAQLYVQVCDVEHARTDNAVYASLNLVNETRLNYARNDFERNSGFTYDLVPRNVDEFADITQLKIRKTGDNGLCIRAIRLLINNTSVFEKTFSALWLDGNSTSVTFPLVLLQLHEDWKSYVQPFPPSRITAGEMESRIEALVATFVLPYYRQLKWKTIGDEAVTITRKDGNTLKVDLDLMVVMDNWFDQDLDLDFDLDIRCSDGQMTAKASNVRPDIDSNFYDPVSLVVDLLDETVIGDAVGSIGIQTVNPCPVITVDENGALVFSIGS